MSLAVYNLGAPSHEYTYELAGNMAVDDTLGVEKTTYTWDGENRLLRVRNAAAYIDSKYDGDGLRGSVFNSATGTTSRHLWDGKKLLLERTGTTIDVTYT